MKRREIIRTSWSNSMIGIKPFGYKGDDKIFIFNENMDFHVLKQNLMLTFLSIVFVGCKKIEIK